MDKQQIRDERYWVESFREGDELSLAHFFKLHYRSLCYFVTKIIQDVEEAEDIVTVAFVKLWESRNNFQTATNIKAFLFISCRNASLNYLKQLQRLTVNQQEYVHHLETGDEEVLNHVVESEFLNTLYQEIALLPEQCRKVFSMIYFDGKRTSEIAQILNLSEKTVRNYKARAIDILHNSYLKKSISDAFSLIFFLFICKR